MHFAKHAAASGLLNGWKSVELAQAYLLMSLYGVPARRWEEDRNWLYTGLAIRCALVVSVTLEHFVLMLHFQDRNGSKLARRV